MPSAPLTLTPLSGRCDRTWPVPGSKSLTNRALLLAAVAEGASRLTGVLASDDTRHMRSCLTAMGATIREVGADVLEVSGGLGRLHAPTAPLFIGNSGTTVRFCAALAALLPGTTTFVGDEHMAKRPIADLVDGLRQLGVDVRCPTGCPPLTVVGGGGVGGGGGDSGGGVDTRAITMRGDRSSQYFSAVLLIAGMLDKGLEISLDGPLVSVPYVEMTRRLVADFGGRIDLLGGGDRIVPGQTTGFVVRAAAYRGRAYRIEPDASSASYPFALAAAGGHRITVELDSTSLQGDYGFVGLLERMGATVERAAGRTTVRGTGRLLGIDADLHHLSDTVMTLAAIAPLATGPTTIRNIANIRIKETDRLLATVNELRRLGQLVEHGDDWLRIHPRPVAPAIVECYADHRMAMSFAVLGSVVPGISIADPDCTAKTYPGFWRDLAGCGG